MISVEYLNWLYNLYGNPEYKLELFRTLSEINYIWQFQLDSNHAYGVLQNNDFRVN